MKQITEKQYEKIHPYLPVQRGNVRISNITFINALLFVMETGCTWRALPKRFGNWYSVHARFRRWSHSGALDRLFAALRDQHVIGEDVECFGLDGTKAQKKAGDKASANRTTGGTRRSA